MAGGLLTKGRRRLRVVHGNGTVAGWESRWLATMFVAMMRVRDRIPKFTT